MVTSSKDPPCSRCLENDRMLNLPDTTTDFGGVVSVWVCQRCGIVAISTRGKGRQRMARGYWEAKDTHDNLEEEAMVHHDPGLITRLCRLRHSLAQDSPGLGRGGESG